MPEEANGMTSPIDFYFDFSSPYGYIASTKIDHIATKFGRTVYWRPFMIGAIYKVIGGPQIPDQRAKFEYIRRDLPRSAAYYGVPFKFAPTFPETLVAPARTVWWLNDRDPALAGAFAKKAYVAYWYEGLRIADIDVTVDIAGELGVDKEALRSALGDQALKDRLRRETDDAIARGVFGSPYIVVDGEPFWGSDRLVQIEAWLESGGGPR
jgi:2-hydroxychromene-2-carboxylate isomerase